MAALTLLVVFGAWTSGAGASEDAAPGNLVLSDPGSEVYYTLAVAAGERIQLAGGAEIVGNVHSNGEIQLENGSRIDGVASAVGRVKPQGEVTGGVIEGAAEILLPALLDEAGLRALADRVIEGDATFDVDLVVDDVLLVAGTARIRGSLDGTGTLIVLGDLRLDGAETPIAPGNLRLDSTPEGGDGQGSGELSLDEGTLLSLIVTGDVRFGKGRPFRGVVRAGRDVAVEKDVTFDGVIVADRRVDVDKDSVVRFLSPDTMAPVITLVSPEDGALLATSEPVIEVTLEDDLSGVDPETLVVLLDGEDVTADVTRTETGFTFTPDPLPDGSHELQVTVSDVAGNEATAAFGFVTDTVPPTVAITSPSEPVIDEEDLVVVTVEYTDATTGVDPSTVRVFLDDLELTPVCAVGESKAECFLVDLPAFEIEPGEHTVRAEVRDLVGNLGEATFGFEVVAGDTTPPTVLITAPQPGLFVTETRPVIDVSYRDDESGVAADTLAFSVDGAPLPADCTVGTLGARCTPTQDLPEGGVNLAASVADQAGNVGTASVAFVVDSAGLEVTVTSPEDGRVTADEQIAVTGSVTPEAASVEINGVPASLTGTSFSATVPLREGVNMIVALATKSNGRTGTDTIEVTRDLVAPTVRITSPSDGFRSTTPEVAVTGLVNDFVSGPVRPEVRVNGTPVAVEGGAFMLGGLELVPGPNVLEAVATDAVGNEGRHQITVQFQPPVGPRIGIAAGQGQSGVVDKPLAEPLVTQVTDDLGNPVAGRFVTFEVSRNSGTLQAQPTDPPARKVQVPTDGAGRAAVLFTLGDTAGEGNNRVRATAVGAAGEVEFCATALPAPPDKILMVDGDNQRGTVGHPLPQPLEALVVDVEGNPLEGVVVTFRVVRGGGILDGQSQLVKTTGVDGLARAVLTLGPGSEISGNVVTATFPGLTGLPATFTSTGLVPGDPAQTRLAGVVLDNGQTPIPGARVFIDDTDLETVTDEEGQFELTGVPVGLVHLVIDPTDSPRPETFPPLAFETVTVAGRRNTIGQPILIPAIATESSKIVGGSEDVTLTMPGVEGLELTVFANSVTFPDGSTTGQLSISQVHLDKVPMPPPSGTIFMPPAWTIQPAGVKFDPPARISIPNDGLAPGRVIDIFQFDHALNEFVNVGKGSTSDDGFVIVSEPGFGITRAGWGGCGQPQPPPTCGENDPCEQSAEDTEKKADDFAESNPNAEPFARIQACIAREGCKGAANGDFQDNEWVQTVIPKFIDKFLQETGDWNDILDECKDPPATSFHKLVPAPLVAKQWCARKMAQHHIENDLLDAMMLAGEQLGDPERGCGKFDQDWSDFFDIIKKCIPEGELFDPFNFAESEVEKRRDTVRANCKEKIGQ